MTFEIYNYLRADLIQAGKTKSQATEYRWRLKARNGRIIACSGEGYKRKLHCEFMCRKIMNAASYGNVRIKYV